MSNCDLKALKGNGVNVTNCKDNGYKKVSKTGAQHINMPQTSPPEV